MDASEVQLPDIGSYASVLSKANQPTDGPLMYSPPKVYSFPSNDAAPSADHAVGIELRDSQLSESGE